MCMGRSLINYLNIEKCDDDVCVFLFLHDIYMYMCMVCIGQIFTSFHLKWIRLFFYFMAGNLMLVIKVLG